VAKRKGILLIFLSFILWICPACAKESPILETGEGSQTTIEPETKEVNSSEESSDDLIYVYVCGQVNAPGVYELLPGDRWFQAVEMAGGISENGDLSCINLASVLGDGERVYIPAVGESEWSENPEETASDVSKDYVDINRAAREELMTLPGIGEKKADAIIAYREKEGPFESKDALMNVPGIKEGLYEKIEDLIEAY